MALLAVRMWRQRSTPKWGWVTLIGGAAVTVVLFVLWARHADALNQASSGMTFENMRGWFFGSTITSTSLWTTVWQRFSDNLGTVGLVVVALGAASIPTVRTRYRPELWALILSNVAYIAIFANLNRIHDYYQLPCYVTLSLLGGLGVWSVGRVVRAAAPAMARPAMAGILVVLAVTWGLYLMKSYFNPLSMALLYRDQGIELRAHTPDRRLVVLAEGADPNEPMLFYEARRIGWRIPSENQAAATSRIRGARDLGGIAVVLGPHGVPTYLPALARERGFRRSYQSPDMVVYTPA